MYSSSNWVFAVKSAAKEADTVFKLVNLLHRQVGQLSTLMTLKYSNAEMNVWKFPVDAAVMLGTLQHLLVSFWLGFFWLLPKLFAH